ncbi:hypothetical protein [Vibrio aestuarianus]|uniref:hypothetical protein n=1 Tax=Vibrio aestuarianus TaxID=28171 RepID=UPI00237C9399|nr:hypothetical protein [Vibrio aestuarianus]MDE1333605.1 hypothetical protein [Vibrio aestuarianus]
MKLLSIEECQRDLKALDAADQLTTNMEREIGRFKSMEMKDLIGKATKMLMTGNLSLEALGLPTNFFEQLEQLAKLNDVARKKYRAHVVSNLNQLDNISDADFTEVGGKDE